MNGFARGQRIRVCDPDHRLANVTGTVVGPCSHSLAVPCRAAWVEMDADPPVEIQSYPTDDPSGRGRWVILYPFECRPVAVAPSLN